MRYLSQLILAITISSISFFATADIVTYQDGLNGYNDVHATSIGLGGNLSSEPTLNLSGSIFFSLIRFDNMFGSAANQIEVGSTINSATLTLNVNTSASGGASPHSFQEYSVWDPVKDWDPLTVTYGNYAVNRFTPLGTDCEVTVCAMGDIIAQSDLVGSFTPSLANTSFQLDLTSLVQMWADDDSTNFGILLGDIDGNNVDSAVLFSDETGAVGPALTIDFTAVDVPTPGTLLLFLTGLIALRRR